MDLHLTRFSGSNNDKSKFRLSKETNQIIGNVRGMKYKLLGKSGLRVSELCLGTMTFGEDWGWGAPKEESKKIFDAFVEAGGNFIDTANRYTDGSSEKFLGEFISGDRDRFVIATKYTLNMRKGDPNAGGNHRKALVQSLEASLERLHTDYIDLYWVHVWDSITPIDEVMRALNDIVSSGKVLYVGISDAPAWVVARANTIAELRGWNPLIGLQIEYSLVQRTPERDLLPMARALDIGITAWSPLARGILTGKYLRNEEGRLTATGRTPNERFMEIAKAVQKVAGEIGCSPAQVALNWLLKQEGTIIPIVGTRKIVQLEDNLGSVAIGLSQDHLDQLNAVTSIELGFPHDFLQGEMVKELVFGGTYSQLANLQMRG